MLLQELRYYPVPMSETMRQAGEFYGLPAFPWERCVRRGNDGPGKKVYIVSTAAGPPSPAPVSAVSKCLGEFLRSDRNANCGVAGASSGNAGGGQQQPPAETRLSRWATLSYGLCMVCCPPDGCAMTHQALAVLRLQGAAQLLPGRGAEQRGLPDAAVPGVGLADAAAGLPCTNPTTPCSLFCLVGHAQDGRADSPPAQLLAAGSSRVVGVNLKDLTALAALNNVTVGADGDLGPVRPPSIDRGTSVNRPSIKLRGCYRTTGLFGRRRHTEIDPPSRARCNVVVGPWCSPRSRRTSALRVGSSAHRAPRSRSVLAPSLATT